MSPPTNQHLVFLQAGCPSCYPTTGIEALKGNQDCRAPLVINHIHHYHYRKCPDLCPYLYLHVFQMLQSDLVSQKKTANAIREEGERIVRSPVSIEASRSTQDSLLRLDDSLAVLESRLSQRVDQLTAALSEVRHSTTDDYLIE